MTGETVDERATSSEFKSVPAKYKAIVHGVSLLLPPLLWLLYMVCLEEFRRACQRDPMLLVVMAAMAIVWTLILYAIAGGFDWTPGAIGCFRTLLYAVLGGVLFAIPLFILWMLIRVVCSLAFGLPLAAGAGKIWVTGRGAVHEGKTPRFLADVFRFAVVRWIDGSAAPYGLAPDGIRTSIPKSRTGRHSYGRPAADGPRRVAPVRDWKATTTDRSCLCAQRNGLPHGCCRHVRNRPIPRRSARIGCRNRNSAI